MKAKDLRLHLHQHPELSGKEVETGNLIAQLLSGLNVFTVERVAETGVLASIDTGVQGPTILFRCELDALPIAEVNNFAHKSNKDGVSHKCGHDGHAAIMYNLAQLIAQNPIQKGKVMLLFQPAEETGEGAKAVMNDAVFNAHAVDEVFALHNIPGKPMQQVSVKTGVFTPAVISLIVKFIGKTSHAAEPQKGINPAQVMSQFILESLKYNCTGKSLDQELILTPIYQVLGEKAYGTSAGYGEVHFTIRAYNQELMKKTKTGLVLLAQRLCEANRLEMKHQWVEEFYANVNEAESVNTIKQAAQKLHLKIEELDEPFRWGEDFGYFTQKMGGAMFGLGSGIETPALHNPDYDFPDALISTGAQLFYSIIKEKGLI